MCLGRFLRQFEVAGLKATNGFIALSSDESTLLVAQFGKVAVCDLATGATKRVVEEGMEGVEIGEGPLPEEEEEAQPWTRMSTEPLPDIERKIDILLDKRKTKSDIQSLYQERFGEVLEVPDEGDQFTKGILAFNETIRKDPAVEQVILPVRDGIMLIRKKQE